MPTIGLIVSKSIGYSETFYHLDIRTWQRLGYEVIVMPTIRETRQTENKYSTSWPPKPLSQNPFTRSLQLLQSFLKISTRPKLLKNSIRFLLAERNDGKSLRKAFGTLYANQHILGNRRIDILIFGYGNLAVTRENLGKALNAQTIVSFKGADISIYPYQFDQDIYKAVFKKGFFFYFVSKALREKARRQGFSKLKRAYVIPAYIDDHAFPDPMANDSPNQLLKLIAVGRLHWVKGHIYLIMAMKTLIDRGIKVALQLIGDGEQYEQLFWACKTLGLENQVTFRGSLAQQEVLRQMKGSDLLVHPSLSEGTPNVVLEALYLKLPCIVTNWPGADEIIRHQWNGWIVKKRSPEAIANQIEAFLHFSAIEKEKITANGSTTIQETFNAQTQEAAFQRLLADALPGS